MADKWKKVRTKLAEDSFDEDFEKFLNESLSDDSPSSPRRSLTPRASLHKAKILSNESKEKTGKWWNEDIEDSSVLADIVKKTWQMRKDTDEPAGDDLQESPHSVDKKQSQNNKVLTMSKDSLDIAGSRPGTALDTILSEPEYSSFEEVSESNEDSETGTSRSSKASHHQTDDNEEENEKKEFFSQIEKDGTVDFAQLNEDFNKNVSEEDGTEVTGLTAYVPPDYNESSEEGSGNNDSNNSLHSNHSSSNTGDETSSQSSEHQEKSTPNADNSLLSKVALMESLDSTAGLKLAEKLQKMNKELKPKVLEKVIPEHDENKHDEDGDKQEPLKTESFELLQREVEPYEAVQSGNLVLDQGQDNPAQLHDFHLQPIISNFEDEPKIPRFPGSSDTVKTLQKEITTAEIVRKLDEFKHSTPANEANSTEMHGFSLEPINNAMMESNSPPTESLKSIKSIAAERRKKLFVKPEKRDVETRDIKKRNAIAQRELVKKLSAPKRPATNQVALQSLQKKDKVKNQTPQKRKSLRKRDDDHDDGVNQTGGSLIASVESFASYLKDYAESVDQHPGSTLKKDFDRDAHLSALAREKSLQQELRDMRVLYETESNRVETFHREALFKEKQWLREKEKINTEHYRRLKDTQDEMAVLQKKLQMKDCKQDANINLEVVGDEEFKKLYLQLEQQETLLSGYQQENERLYAEVKKANNEKKAFETGLLKENQKLALEVANLKEQLDSRNNFDSMSGSAAMGAQRISQLENQVKFYQKREQEYKDEVRRLENEVGALQAKLTVYEKSKNVYTTEQVFEKRLKEQGEAHHNQIERLHKKLAWYAENQDLLDRDTVQLKSRRDEINRLNCELDGLKMKNEKLMKEKLNKRDEKGADVIVIADLQRQVREMEDVIKRRHPNSLPAMILAASAVPGEDRVYTTSSQREAHLEKRVQSLQDEQETRDTENAVKIRAIEQRYTAMSLKFEEHIQQLEAKNRELVERFKTEKSVDELLKELEEEKSRNKEIVERLQEEKRQLVANLEAGKKMKDSSETVAKLREKLKARDYVIDELTTTVSLFKKEREKMLSQKMSSSSDCKVVGDVPRSVNGCEELSNGNKLLRNEVENLSILLKESLVKQEAVAAKSEHDQRTLKEGYEERLKELVNQHRNEVERMRMEFVVNHSNSKVAELNGKVASGELIVAHLKGIVEELKEDQNKLKLAKVTEEELCEEITHLKEQLFEARKLHTPEMRHYRELETKVYDMESRYAAREKELREVVSKTKSKAEVDIDFVEDKWRDILRNKDIELDRFRAELDGIIEVLQELQHQGVILPNMKFNNLL